MPLAHPITPHLWFDTQAREAAEFYCRVFPDASIDSVTTLHDTPSGDCDIVSFTLAGQPFMAISAGPLFPLNPSISFFVHFDPSRDADARAHLDALWAQLVDGGQALMALDAYPFSARYGWVQDRFGVSWQLMLVDAAAAPRPMIVPSLLFTGAAYGQAEAAGAFYRSVFDVSQAGLLIPYPAGMDPDRAGTVMYSDFRLGERNWFAAMDSGHAHGFGFNEAISFVVPCRDQAEIDRYWAQLSSVPEAEQCGWCKDRFGVSWQIVPASMNAIMASGDRAVIDRVTQAFLPMCKLDVAKIEAAARGN
ncbi:VOC family protein [Lysobacter helvus]|uniref:VOC family protein n=2 Tax=Lysobacteraceae TaxID=32033 RepID=A0ABM7Q5D1_9GAMM|nr:MULTISPECIES: VOC family protein [Lysobacter]BCT92463.1 VOC family protein [Lysobacter caseinilyticus]BCT95616.1 VOC family protein [Lysobacter helvus]